MKESKTIMAQGKMSNLVGMYALIWDGDKLKRHAYVYGKADDSVYIIQWISGMSGSGNICQLMDLSEMKDWVFCPSAELVEDILKDYDKHQINRYNLFKKL